MLIFNKKGFISSFKKKNKYGERIRIMVQPGTWAGYAHC